MKGKLLFLSFIIVLLLSTHPVKAWWWWNSGPDISINPDGGTYYGNSVTISVTISAYDSDGIDTVYIYKNGYHLTSIDGEECTTNYVYECKEVPVRKCGYEKHCHEEYTCQHVCKPVKVCDKICDGWAHICWETNCRYETKCYNDCGWHWVCNPVYDCWYDYEEKCDYYPETTCTHKTQVSKTISLTLSPGETTLKVVAYDVNDYSSSKTATFKLIPQTLRINSFNVPSTAYTDNNGNWNVRVSYRVTCDCGVQYVKIYVDGREVYSYDGRPWWCSWCWWCPNCDNYKHELSDNPTISGSGTGWHTIKLVAKSVCDGSKSETRRIHVVEAKPKIVYFNVPSQAHAKENEEWSAKVSYRVKCECGIKYVKITVDGHQVYYKSGRSCPWWWCSYLKDISDSPTIRDRGTGKHTVKLIVKSVCDGTQETTREIKVVGSSVKIERFSCPHSTYITDASGNWNARVSYKVTCDCGVEYVRIYVDGHQVYSQSGKPWWCWRCSYQTRMEDNPTISYHGDGWHTIKLVAKSACDGEKSQTKWIDVIKPVPRITTFYVTPTSKTEDANGNAEFTIHVKAHDDVGLDHYEVYDNGRYIKSQDAKFWDWQRGTVYPKDDDTMIKVTLHGVGQHTIKVYAYNKVGVRTEKSATVRITEDNPPQISVTPADGSSFLVDDIVNINGEYYWAKKLTIKVHIYEDIQWKSYTVWLDGEKIAEDTYKFYYTTPHDVDVQKTVYLKTGTHTLRVEAYDVNNHRSVKTVKYTVYCRDSSPPSVTASPTGTIYTTGQGKTINFHITVTDYGKDSGIAHVKITLNGVNIIDRKGKLGNKFEYSFSRTLPVGEHTLHIYARDYSGLETTRDFSIEIVHNSPPSLTISAPNPYYTLSNREAKVPITINAYDSDGLHYLKIYTDNSLRKTIDVSVCDGWTHTCWYPKSYSDTISVSMSLGRHTVKVVAIDKTNTQTSKSITINILHKEPEIKVLYDSNIPYYVSNIPIKVYVNSPEKGSVTVYVNGNEVGSQNVRPSVPVTITHPITDLPNKYKAKKTYTVKVVLKTDSTTKTYTKTITLQRTAEFKPGSSFKFIVTVDKGYGHTQVHIYYNGHEIDPMTWPNQLNRWERAIVNVPFWITVSKSDFVKVVAENEAGKDEKTLYLKTGEVQTPPVNPPPTPTPTPTVPTPPPTPTPPPNYEACYTHVSGGGSNTDYNSGIGYAEAWVAGNEIHVLARQEVIGANPSTAEGYVYTDFDYTTLTHNAEVKVTYYMYGVMDALGVGWGETSYYVKVELIDLTTGKTLGVKEHSDSETLNAIGASQKRVDQTLTDTFNVQLVKGHKYRVKIYAKVTAKALGLGGVATDFAEWEFSGKTRLIKFESVCLKWT